MQEIKLISVYEQGLICKNKTVGVILLIMSFFLGCHFDLKMKQKVRNASLVESLFEPVWQSNPQIPTWQFKGNAHDKWHAVKAQAKTNKCHSE